jgi:hypothetical protein
MLLSQGVFSNPYPEPNLILHIDTYFFKIRSDIVLTSIPRPS